MKCKFGMSNKFFLFGMSALLIFFIVACSNSSTPPAPTYSISGTVSGAVTSGVTINLTGKKTTSTTTGTDGTYTISGLANGYYTVTPALTGYTFSPVSTGVTVSGTNITNQNFTETSNASLQYTVSGVISGASPSGVTITLSGDANGTTTTASNGTFSFTLVNGSYTVTPTLTGYTFSPTSQAVDVSGTSAVIPSFIETAVSTSTYSISGTVSGAVTSGVTINLTGAATTSTTTGTGGTYSFTGLANGYYTVTPVLTGYTFSPSSQAVTISGSDATAQAITATANAGTQYSISGQVTGAVQNGVLITLGGDASATTTTVTSGDYTLAGLLNGTYTVTPSLVGYKFTPYNYTGVDISGSSVSGKDFTSAAAHPTGTGSGTWTWNSSTGAWTMDFTTVNFPCNGPPSGSQPMPSTTITATTMTWPTNHMTWTRSSGTANDPAGTWTSIDYLGNTYTAVVTDNTGSTTSGSISMTLVNITCADVESENQTAWGNDYLFWVDYRSNPSLTSVSVAGTDITGSQSLTYNSSDDDWELPGAIDTGSTTAPTLPATYTFTLNDGTTTWVETAAITCIVATYPTGLGATSSDTPTFSWTGVSDAGAIYRVYVTDLSYNQIWESDRMTGKSVAYNSNSNATLTSLTSGSSYYWYVEVDGTTACPRGESDSAQPTFVAP